MKLRLLAGCKTQISIKFCADSLGDHLIASEMG